MKLSIIIPIFNEKKTLNKILRKVKNANIGAVKKEIIIVDDYSTDGTREILKKINNKNIKILYHKKNLGKGYAIRTGLKEVTGNIILIQDSDLEYDPSDYKKLINPILLKQTRVVYGSRVLGNNKKSSLLFYLGGKIITLFSNFLYNSKITDEPTCYKVFSKDVIKNINLKSKRFEFCPEITAKISKKI